MGQVAVNKKKKSRMKHPLEDRILYISINIIMFLVTLVIAYPVIYVLSSSFSSPADVAAGRVILWPVNPSLEGYKAVLTHRQIVSGYTNTIFYTVVGTLINLVVTFACAYPLSRKDFPFRKFFMVLFTFTMFFSGGLIPTYILITQIGMYNTRWVMIIPGALSVYNMILVRTFLMSTIPDELLESAQIDGCSDSYFFFRIVLPLSTAVIAVISLYYAVGHWNAYFNAMIYINKPELQPLQIILRNILISNQINMTEIQDAESLASKQGMSDLLKHALIIVSSAPIMAFYPFVQKYFIKGVMIGSIKG